MADGSSDPNDTIADADPAPIDPDDADLVGQGGTDSRPPETCFCEGHYPEWDYHHPDGCAKNAHVFGAVSNADADEAWDDARVEGDVIADGPEGDDDGD